MPLAPGTVLGTYEIIDSLGAGGMGEVYRARDTQLKREVALKILSPAFIADPERVARFQREAEVLASLNHPNIAHLYGLAEADGVRALVMELVEGESPRGPMPFDDAWKIMTQVAAGLEYAHERRIIHRDLKPANLKIKPDGRVKILDFGLAKALSSTPAHQAGASADSPTLTMGATQAGVILGTAAYMAPEQIKGKEADRRADIWAFGVVLYELLTGERPFKGSDATELMAHAVTSAPQIDKAPACVKRLIDECLKKDPADRLGWIGDASRLLENPVENRLQAESQTPPSRMPWAAAGVFAILAIAAIAYAYLRQPPPDPLSVRYSIDAPPGSRFANQNFGTDISPDGRYVVFNATRSVTGIDLWVRPTDSLDARELPGTEGSNGPFWSPDGKSIGFVADNKLKRIDLTGGAPQILCDAQNFQGASWGPDGTILFSAGGILQRIPASGGTPTPVTTADAQNQPTGHRFPSFLPGGERFLFTIQNRDPAVEGVYIASLAAPSQRSRLVPGPWKAVYAPPRDGRSGYLLWMRDRTLMAQRFDGKSRLEGDPIPVAQDVARNNQQRAAFWISPNGLLLYRSGGRGADVLQWLNRSGGPETLKMAATLARDPKLSPDSSRVVFDRFSDSDTTGDVWTYDLARGVLTRFTFGQGNNMNPVWSPDGRQIAFDSTRDGPNQIYVKDSAGTGQEQRLTDGPNPKYVADWSRDGRYLLYEEVSPKTGSDVWALPLEGDRKPVPVLQTSFNEVRPQFSPDGKWIAYESDEAGMGQIYIQSFPPSGAKWQVSSTGGSQQVRWRADGKEIYFASLGNIWAVGVHETGSRLELDAPHAVAPYVFTNRGYYFYDPSADGKRFIAFQPPEANAEQANAITAVTNWQATLKQ